MTIQAVPKLDIKYCDLRTPLKLYNYKLSDVGKHVTEQGPTYIPSFIMIGQEVFKLEGGDIRTYTHTDWHDNLLYR